MTAGPGGVLYSIDRYRHYCLDFDCFESSVIDAGDLFLFTLYVEMIRKKNILFDCNMVFYNH